TFSSQRGLRPPFSPSSATRDSAGGAQPAPAREANMTTLNPYDAPQTIEPSAKGNLTNHKHRRRSLAAIYCLAAACCAILSVTGLLSGLFYMRGGPYWIAWTSLFLSPLLAIISLVLALRGVLLLARNSTSPADTHETSISRP
ncbi:MAG: phage holin family protein, partial [Pirellulaceae bacterium]|nr:phage holin family protein [Pirellulaceae bacterium]